MGRADNRPGQAGEPVADLGNRDFGAKLGRLVARSNRGRDGWQHLCQALRGDPERWDDWNEIRRCNPLVTAFPESRKVLHEERAQARRDSRLKARFLSYRMNVPSPDESVMLLTVADFNAACAREVPPPDGKPIVGIDLGGGRAWSAAVALWSSGRCEAIAVAPGLPGIEAQEKRDRVPRRHLSAIG